jgi:hypothetical protein
VYKGTGTVSFICYWPYAHTPDKVQQINGENWVDVGSGKKYDSYANFINKTQWQAASGLTSSTGTCTGENPGDLPAPFVLTKTGFVSSQTRFVVGDLSITVKDNCYDLEWDSKTGLVSAAATNGGIKKPINFTGQSCGAIPTDGLTSSQLAL